MGVYSSILTAAKTILTALLEPDGWKVKVNDEPKWVTLNDELPGVVVAPRADLAETPHHLAGRRIACLNYDVYVGTFVDDRKQQESWLVKRLDVRETVRLALWTPRSLAVAGIDDYDVDYDPAGAGGTPAPSGVKGSWQRFTIRVQTPRSTA